MSSGSTESSDRYGSSSAVPANSNLSVRPICENALDVMGTAMEECLIVFGAVDRAWSHRSSFVTQPFVRALLQAQGTAGRIYFCMLKLCAKPRTAMPLSHGFPLQRSTQLSSTSSHELRMARDRTK